MQDPDVRKRDTEQIIPLRRYYISSADRRIRGRASGVERNTAGLGGVICKGKGVPVFRYSSIVPVSTKN